MHPGVTETARQACQIELSPNPIVRSEMIRNMALEGADFLCRVTRQWRPARLLQGSKVMVGRAKRVQAFAPRVVVWCQESRIG